MKIFRQKSFFRLKTLTFFLFLIFLISCQNPVSEKQAVIVHCAVGLRPVLETAAVAFEEKSGTKINFQFGGSGALSAALKISRRGDIFIPADESFFQDLQQIGLNDSSVNLFFMEPVLAFKKDNQLNINSLQSILEQNLRLTAANRETAAIGRLTEKILQNSPDYQALKSKILVYKPTVTDTAQELLSGTADAALMWDGTARQFPEPDFIFLPESKSMRQEIRAVRLECSEQKKTVCRFPSLPRFRKSTRNLPAIRLFIILFLFNKTQNIFQYFKAQTMFILTSSPIINEFSPTL